MSLCDVAKGIAHRVLLREKQEPEAGGSGDEKL